MILFIIDGQETLLNPFYIVSIRMVELEKDKAKFRRTVIRLHDKTELMVTDTVQNVRQKLKEAGVKC